MKISQMERVVPLVQKKQPKERVWKKAKDIAEYFGVSLATISKWTNSKNDPLPSRRVRGILQYDFELVKEWEGNVTNQGGAPFGNQNARGNKGNSRASPPVGNKNALKTGEYETIFYETLSDEEKDIYSNLNNDPSFVLSEEIRLLKIRQFRMMKRIQQAEAGLNDDEIERLQQLRKIKTPIEKDGRKLEIKRDVMQDVQVSRKTHRKIDDILSIEDSLTRISNQLAKSIKQMNELYITDYKTDLMKAKTEKIQAEIADIGGNNSGEEVEEWKQAVLNAANKRAVRENE